VDTTEDIIHNVNVNYSGHRNVNSGVQRRNIGFSSLNIPVSDYNHKESLAYHRMMAVNMYELSI
jgi:hypothetical protein